MKTGEGISLLIYETSPLSTRTLLHSWKSLWGKKKRTKSPKYKDTKKRNFFSHKTQESRSFQSTILQHSHHFKFITIWKKDGLKNIASINRPVHHFSRFQFFTVAITLPSYPANWHFLSDFPDYLFFQAPTKFSNTNSDVPTFTQSSCQITPPSRQCHWQRKITDWFRRNLQLQNKLPLKLMKMSCIR